MRKTTLTIDQDFLARASAVLGTRGLQATVDKALAEALRIPAVHRCLDRLATGELNLNDEAVTAGAWR